MPRENAQRAFTLVEVMMASVVLLTVFVGLIEAVTLASNTMDHARRQVIATEILKAELEQLRSASWTTVNGLPTSSTAVAIDPQFWPPWNAAANYSANHVVSRNGAWYRCIQANNNTAPPNATYWTSVVSGATSDIVVLQGATFSLTRTMNTSTPVSTVREVTFTVSWVVRSSRRDTSNNPLTFTFSRSSTGWYGKYGLNLTYQRS